MKFLPLIWAGLWRRPLRTALTMLSLAVAFLLYGAIEGLGAGFDAMQAAAKLDRIFTDPRFGTPLPLAYTDQIARVPGVRVVAPRDVLFGYYQDPKNVFGAITTDERFFAVRDELAITKEQIESWRKTRNGLVIGTEVAARRNMKLGDQISVHAANVTKSDGGRDFAFEIVAIVDDVTNPGGASYVVANYEYINEERSDHKNEVSRFLMRVDDPERVTQISREIDKLFANSSAPTRTQSDQASAQSGLNQFGSIKFFVNTIVGSVLFMLLFITGNTMMQSFRERIPEFAVLKTLGFSDAAVLALVIAESLFQCLIGAAAGLAIAKIGMPVFRTHTVLAAVLIVPWRTVLAGLAVAIAVAFASGIVPALRAKRLDVVNALAGR